MRARHTVLLVFTAVLIAAVTAMTSQTPACPNVSCAIISPSQMGARYTPGYQAFMTGPNACIAKPCPGSR